MESCWDLRALCCSILTRQLGANAAGLKIWIQTAKAVGVPDLCELCNGTATLGVGLRVRNRDLIAYLVVTLNHCVQLIPLTR